MSASNFSAAEKASQDLPYPLTNAYKVQELCANDVKSADQLQQWLVLQDMDLSQWGTPTRKSVSDLHTELLGKETGLELWRQDNLQTRILRVVHVLRGKVCSSASRQKGIFLFNSWQQFPDGRKRERNGLLSEKLSLSELPVKDNLHSVSKRAVSEEMTRLVTKNFELKKESKPVLNADDPYPFTVKDVIFIDHTVEVEESKSFVGLMTMYHLYTIDIVCDGLPDDDFNTLEFKPGGDIKYVHSWKWAEWKQIKMFLFTGSTRKDEIKKGRFTSAKALAKWLRATGDMVFYMTLWGVDKAKDYPNLFHEIEQAQATLELWSRNDGVSLLVRVLHVLRGNISTPTSLKTQRFLFNTWQQFPDGRVRNRDLLLSTKIRANELADKNTFVSNLLEISENAVRRILRKVCSPNFQIVRGDPLPKYNPDDVCDIHVLDKKFQRHTDELEESVSFPGLLTIYHLYTVDLLCDNLPNTDFNSIEFDGDFGFRNIFSWKWVQWPQIMDLFQRRVHAADARGRLLSNEVELCVETFDSMKTLLLQALKASNGRDILLELLRVVEDSAKRAKEVSKCEEQKTMPIDILRDFVRRTQSQDCITPEHVMPEKLNSDAWESQNCVTNENLRMVDEGTQTPTSIRGIPASRRRLFTSLSFNADLYSEPASDPCTPTSARMERATAVSPLRLDACRPHLCVGE